jgi:hypothetical protein
VTLLIVLCNQIFTVHDVHKRCSQFWSMFVLEQWYENKRRMNETFRYLSL